MQFPADPDAPAGDARLARLASEWDELAEADAMWAVLSDPARKGGGWTREEFLASGTETVEGVLERAARLGRPRSRGAALDFGCGAGRLVWGLSPHFERVVGVDVSAGMTRLASAFVAGRPNAEIRLNDRADLSQFPDGSFDLVLTLIVLQHVPEPELALGYVGELVRVTAPGGVAVIQAPARVPLPYRMQPLRRAYAGLRRLGVPARALILRTPLQPMRMTALPRPAVEAAAARAGGKMLEVEPDGAEGFVYYVAGPEPAEQGQATGSASTSASRATSAA